MLFQLFTYNEFNMEVHINESYSMDILAYVIMNYDMKDIYDHDEIGCALAVMSSYYCAQIQLDLDLKNRPTPSKKNVYSNYQS